MSFKDCEKLVVELKNFMFKSLYTWTAVYNSPHFSNFSEFLFFFFFLIGGLSYILRLRPLA
jgi:NADH:ubiquinone oxidoreductase subunit 3 (subunit A)